MNSLNSIEREKNLDRISEFEWDVLIIGGGITGAGIALDAASRGMRVLLCEKQDFAAGTSSRSTKLIHGGLRYLKQFSFGMVSESGRERAILHRLAPHIIKPQKMLLPIKKGGSYSALLTSIGLWLYDFLAGVEKQERRKMLSAKETLIVEPLLKNKDLIGGGLYWEYSTEDNRLVIDIIRKAVKLGAACFNYLEFSSPIYHSNKISGGLLKDNISGKTFQVKAKQIVNASGPWVDQVRNLETKTKANSLRHTRGVHLVFKKENFPIQQACYFEMAGGRMVFGIPHNEVTYLGTTDTDYRGPLEKPGINQSDVSYLLEGANSLFNVSLTEHEIIATWSGLRPLIQQKGKDPSEVSRKDEIFVSPSGMISIAGGKLTGYRKMAQRVTDTIAKNVKGKFEKGKTDSIALQPPGINENQALKEKIRYWVLEEAARFPSDILSRRTSWAYFEPKKVEQHNEEIIHELSELFPKNTEMIRKEFDAYKAERKEMMNWK